MKIRVLGCYGAELSKYSTCGYLINGSVLMDAGTVCSALTLAEQRKIRYILISHIHTDHIHGLAALSENLIAEKERTPVVIISVGKVIAGLKRHFFNDQIWPDFTRLPNRRHPVYRLRSVQEGETIKVNGLHVKAISVNHVVPSTGFLVRENGSSLLYSGDTGMTEQLWKVAAKDDSLKAAMVETTFPDALKELAYKSKHLTPSLLYKEFLKIGKPQLALYVHHMKPRYRGKIKQELRRLKFEKLVLLDDGMVFNV
jgi:ribonuclease BN (tRNA processing enzyme)